MNDSIEQTLVLIKPDVLKNSLTGYVLSQLSEFHTGIHFAGMKVIQVSKMLAEEHYSEHQGKVFFNSLIDYITGYIHYPNDSTKRRVIAIVYQGMDAIKKIRSIAGPTDPHLARETQPGCIRSLGTIVPLENDKGENIGSRMENLIHASASLDEAKREIKLWFKPHEIPPSMRIFKTRQADQHIYYNNNIITTNNEPDSVCVLAPGDIVWGSDLNCMNAILNAQQTSCTLETIIAKYLVNRD